VLADAEAFDLRVFPEDQEVPDRLLPWEVLWTLAVPGKSFRQSAVEATPTALVEPLHACFVKMSLSCLQFLHLAWVCLTAPLS
jgi:hypothetical protein